MKNNTSNFNLNVQPLDLDIYCKCTALKSIKSSIFYLSTTLKLLRKNNYINDPDSIYAAQCILKELENKSILI